MLKGKRNASKRRPKKVVLVLWPGGPSLDGLSGGLCFSISWVPEEGGRSRIGLVNTSSVGASVWGVAVGGLVGGAVGGGELG